MIMRSHWRPSLSSRPLFMNHHCGGNSITTNNYFFGGGYGSIFGGSSRAFWGGFAGGFFGALWNGARSFLGLNYSNYSLGNMSNAYAFLNGNSDTGTKESDTDKLKKMYPDYTFTESGGRLYATKDNLTFTATSFDEMVDKFNKKFGTKTDSTKTDTTKHTGDGEITAEAAQQKIKDAGLEGKISIADGKIKYTDATGAKKEVPLNVANLDDAIADLKPSATTQRTGTTGNEADETGTITEADARIEIQAANLSDKVKVEGGKIIYNGQEYSLTRAGLDSVKTAIRQAEAAEEAARREKTGTQTGTSGAKQSAPQGTTPRKWTDQDDPGFGHDQQFIAASGRTYEVLDDGKFSPDHLNRDNFKVDHSEDGPSVITYIGDYKVAKIKDEETGEEFNATVKDDNRIYITIKENGENKDILLEEFLSGDYAEPFKDDYEPDYTNAATVRRLLTEKGLKNLKLTKTLLAYNIEYTDTDGKTIKASYHDEPTGVQSQYIGTLIESL